MEMNRHGRVRRPRSSFGSYASSVVFLLIALGVAAFAYITISQVSALSATHPKSTGATLANCNFAAGKTHTCNWDYSVDGKPYTQSATVGDGIQDGATTTMEYNPGDPRDAMTYGNYTANNSVGFIIAGVILAIAVACAIDGAILQSKGR